MLEKKVTWTISRISCALEPFLSEPCCSWPWGIWNNCREFLQIPLGDYSAANIIEVAYYRLIPDEDYSHLNCLYSRISAACIKNSQVYRKNRFSKDTSTPNVIVSALFYDYLYMLLMDVYV